MFEVDKFTRTENTEAAYTKQAVFMLENYAKNAGKDWDQDHGQLIDWLSSKRDSSSAAYWGRIRSALVFFFKNNGNPDLAASIKAISKDRCAPPTHTSANKKKSVSDTELVSLANYLLREGSSKISIQTYQFFLSGIITGMRPSEWEFCDFRILRDAKELRLQDFGGGENVSPEMVDGIKIVVQNAKATNGRAHGEFRTLLFPKLHPQEKEVLLDHYRSVEHARDLGQFPLFQRQCSDKLRYAGQKLWPSKRKRISLYSGRHQSMANGKASNLPANVIAAMHGHATDRTAGEHYGRKQFGVSGRVYMQVPADEVARVREIPSTWSPPAISREKERNNSGS
ncbi:hypothetical protein [Cellvibrio sp. QJXJ]|uniref:hypothetical protein n=1 Tax=Cellvibrio sp. QJXJ TaxID=2964606 RepID=UPI0021C3AC86|nr:hypothetical protein [Cellvibrio sp. QJXJ]UUA75140.1 hypothetical protein NNX04_22040 [Cellvibrio sp. QJXJ]